MALPFLVVAILGLAHTGKHSITEFSIHFHSPLFRERQGLCYLALAGFECAGPLASASQVLGVQACATMPAALPYFSGRDTLAARMSHVPQTICCSLPPRHHTVLSLGFASPPRR